MLQNFSVNVYQNVSKPTVNQTISIYDWLEKIKSSEYSETIKQARIFGKDSDIYKSIKKSIPCVTYNFLFKDYKKNSNIFSSTGLIFIDIDNSDFDINTINKDKVFCYYKSFGGNGYSILVKVENLDYNNFEETYLNIVNELNLMTYYDDKAVKHTQYSILSFDPNIFINHNSYIFKSNQNKKVSFGINKEKNHIGILPNDTFSESKIRFNNIDDYFKDNDDDYILFEEKQNIVKPFIPVVTNEGSRNQRMYYLLSQYALLNMDYGDAFLNSLANTINNTFTPKLEQNEIKQIIKSVIKKRANNELELNYNEPRRIIFNPKKQISGEQRRIISNKKIGEFRTNKTLQKIYDCIEDWNFKKYNKITQKNISIELGISIPTIKRYWKNFKDYVYNLNKTNISKTIESESNQTINISEPKSILDNIRLNDSIEVIEFLKQLYIENNLEVDTKSIVEIGCVLNKSYATVQEIIMTLVTIVKNNKYEKSDFKNIRVPTPIIQMIIDNKQKLLAA